MKEKILKIVNGPLQAEPIYQLESEFKSLIDDEQKREFLSIIKSLALHGTDKEKFISLSTIEFLNKAKEFESVIKRNIDTCELKEDNKLISPLLSLCAVLSTNWAIDFIQEIIKHFHPKSNEYSYYFDIGIRSMVSTARWNEVTEEIKWAMQSYEDNYVIDFVAYFKWKRGNQGLEKLFRLLASDSFSIKKINNLKAKIIDRYVNNYEKLKHRSD